MVSPELWFGPEVAWIPGTLLGIAGGAFGAMAGVLAPRGKAKGLVLGFTFFLLTVCAALLVGGVAALASGQAYGVWYALLLPGAVGLIVFGALTPMVLLRYRQAEYRRSLAKDL